MKRFWILPMLMLAVASCGGDEPELPQHPTLEPASLEMLVGETRQLTVLHATAVTVEFASDIANVTNDGPRIMVEAVKEGDGTIKVVADGVSLSCPLHIVGYGDEY